MSQDVVGRWALAIFSGIPSVIIHEQAVSGGVTATRVVTVAQIRLHIDV